MSPLFRAKVNLNLTFLDHVVYLGHGISEYVENTMVDNPDNNSSLVKLVEKLLDDESGINDKAYDALHTFLAGYYGSRPFPSRLQKMLDVVEGTDNRVYIGEDWDETPVKEKV